VVTNVPLMHQVVVAQLAAARQGTHKTKGRGEVSGAGRKPFKQKGTGRARQGSIRAPQHRGGGIVHGPVPRDYSQRTPKKMIQKALLSALSDRARADRIHVVRAWEPTRLPSTKVAAALSCPDCTGPQRPGGHWSRRRERSEERSELARCSRHSPRPAQRLRRAQQRRHHFHRRSFGDLCGRKADAVAKGGK
jgi:hypothetical protein